jgi:hypothetical protein
MGEYDKQEAGCAKIQPCSKPALHNLGEDTSGNFNPISPVISHRLFSSLDYFLRATQTWRYQRHLFLNFKLICHIFQHRFLINQ